MDAGVAHRENQWFCFVDQTEILRELEHSQAAPHLDSQRLATAARFLVIGQERKSKSQSKRYCLGLSTAQPGERVQVWRQFSLAHFDPVFLTDDPLNFCRMFPSLAVSHQFIEHGRRYKDPAKNGVQQSRLPDRRESGECGGIGYGWHAGISIRQKFSFTSCLSLAYTPITKRL